MVLDEFGRIPGGILPDNPCYPDLDYSFRSFASFVDASDKPSAVPRPHPLRSAGVVTEHIDARSPSRSLSWTARPPSQLGSRKARSTAPVKPTGLLHQPPRAQHSRADWEGLRELSATGNGLQSALTSALEQKLAKSVFDFHTKDLTGGEDYDEDKSGAEWWTLVLDNQDDIGLHWDRELPA
eukprot:3722235-Rhodomonas_salina.1